MLLALIIGQRVHTLHSLDLTFMNIEDDHVNIEIHEILKTSKLGKHLTQIPDVWAITAFFIGITFNIGTTITYIET
jgi:hypothetical protein